MSHELPIAFATLLTSWQVHLRAEGKAEKTLGIYTEAATALGRFAASAGAADWTEVGRDTIREWTLGMLQTLSPSYASMKWRAAQQLFRWLADEDEIDTNPMIGMKPPKLPERVVPVLENDQLTALFDSCKGRDFTNRRDLAILRLFASTGMRLGELAGLRTDTLNVQARTAKVIGKGNRERIARFDPQTAAVLDRYDRVRRTHKWAALPNYWLGERGKGAMTPSGIAQIVERRGEMVGLDIHAHQFRHTFAHRYLAAGGNEGDLMEQAGWRSAQMVRRYGASAKAERARSAYDRVDVMGDL